MVSRFSVCFIRGQTWLIRCCLSSLPKKLSVQNESLLKLDDKTGTKRFLQQKRSKGGAYVVILFYRPIPQWFRLKTDTKIQVRSKTLPLCFLTTHSDNRLFFSTMPNVVTGEGPNWTFKALFFFFTLRLRAATSVGLVEGAGLEKREKSQPWTKNTFTDPLPLHTSCSYALTMTHAFQHDNLAEISEVLWLIGRLLFFSVRSVSFVSSQKLTKVHGLRVGTIKNTGTEREHRREDSKQTYQVTKR